MEATTQASAFVLVIIFGGFCCVLSNAESIRLARNKEFDGLTCPVSQTIFNEDRANNKIQCASLCTEASSCVGFFHHPQTNDCVGCSSFVKDDAPILEGMQFYARNPEYFERYILPIDCGELTPIAYGSVILNKVDGTFYNDTATVTCHANKTYRIACTEAGSWGTVSCPQYILVETRSNWWEAKEACESLGGRLADIKSKEEQNSIEEYIHGWNPTVTKLWVGGRSISDGFVWLDGTAVNGTYAHWYPVEPDSYVDTCIYVMQKTDPTYFWFDHPYTYLHGGVCEFD